jgi:aerobic-type carbon monoxide dehydrogenase small subunit (CoxS/CutS family)
MPQYTIQVNGRRHVVEADPAMPLLWVLRDRLHLFGTKFGCGVGICGACTVLDGQRAVRSCGTSVSAAANRSFTTIEGLSSDASHPCQAAWLEADVAQCGFCQGGMIMEAVAFLHENRSPSDDEIDRRFADHVCRCGTYNRIRSAVHEAARRTAAR